MPRLLEPLPLVLLATAAGLAAPSPALAGRSDAILALLVLAVALGTDPSRLREAAWRRRQVVLAALLPLVTLLPLALALGPLFDPSTRQGLLALGLAPTEVAAVALVALAGGRVAPALATMTLSLVVTAAATPLLVPLLAAAEVDVLTLIGRFSIVVLGPLVLGLGLRALVRGARIEPAAERVATLALALLVYAALGDLGDRSQAGPAALAAALFLAASVPVGLVLARLLGGIRTGAFTFCLRDFAVAAALAGQLGAPGAAATPAIYGALMLAAAAGAAALLRRRAPAAPSRRHAPGPLPGASR